MNNRERGLVGTQTGTQWAAQKSSISRHYGINFGPSGQERPTVSRMNIDAILEALDAGLDLEQINMLERLLSGLNDQGITDEQEQYRAAVLALQMGLR
jgi:hypothetical protein